MYWNSLRPYPTTWTEGKRKSVLYGVRGFAECYGQEWYVEIWVYRFHNRSLAPKYYIQAQQVATGADFFTGDIQVSEYRHVSRETIRKCFPVLLCVLKDYAGIRLYNGV